MSSEPTTNAPSLTGADACPGNPAEEWELLVHVSVADQALAPLVVAMVRHHAGVVAGMQFNGAYFAPCDAEGHEIEDGGFSPWFGISAAGPTDPSPEVIARVARIVSNAALPATQNGVETHIEVTLPEKPDAAPMFPEATGVIAR